jgi:hypothetical protein
MKKGTPRNQGYGKDHSKEKKMKRLPPQTLLLGVPLIIMELIISCASSPGLNLSSEALEAQGEAASVVEYMTPGEVNLTDLVDTELIQDNETHKILEQADTLARSRIGYRTDKRDNPLTRAFIGSPPNSLSCTEFIWLVYSSAGLDLGNFHIETKELAYDRGAYSPYLTKLRPSEKICAGDTLVYEYPDQELIREEEQTGHYRAGHAVIVVSVNQKIVIGSHGDESTPPGAPTGVGYRRLLNDWGHWTAGRTLKAIYRLKKAQDRQTIEQNQK